MSVHALRHRQRKRYNANALAAFGLLIALALGAPAADFSPWARRMPITFIGYDKPGTLTNFPILVKLGTNLAGFSYSDFASPTDGGDLRFSDATETNELNCEIETWDTNGTSFVWVQVPAIAGTNTRVHAFWGNGSAIMPAYATNGATWSEGFRGVWHMGQTNVLDSTANGNNGTGKNGITTTAAGASGTALSLDGSDDYVDLGTGLTMGTNSATLSIWFRTTSSSLQAGLIGKSSLRAQDGRYVLLALSGIIGLFDALSVNVEPSTPWVSAYYDNTWHQATVTFHRTGNLTVYVDGVSKVGASISAAASDVMAGTDPWMIGAYGNESGSGPKSGLYFPGSLDEGRLMTVAASSNWVWASYMNAASNAAFQTHGAAELVTTQLTVTALAPSGIEMTSATANGRVVQTGGGGNPAVYVC